MVVPVGTQLIVHTQVGQDFYKITRGKVVRYTKREWVSTQHKSLHECGMFKECTWL